MGPARATRVLCALAVVIVTGASVAAASSPSYRLGTWSGKTAQGRSIKFVADQGMLKDVVISIRMNCMTFSQGGPPTHNKVLRIASLPIKVSGKLRAARSTNRAAGELHISGQLKNHKGSGQFRYTLKYAYAAHVFTVCKSGLVKFTVAH